MSKTQLTHVQFYRTVEAAKLHRDGIAKTGTLIEAAAFLSEKLRQQGEEFRVSPETLARALDVANLPRPVRQSPRRTRTTSDRYHDLEILTRAVAKLYETLGMPLTPGLDRLLRIARHQATQAVPASCEPTNDLHEPS